MVASELYRLHRRLGHLTAENGQFYVACARTGIRPSPVAAARFGTRRLAENAAKRPTEYRAQLRSLDSDLPLYDLVATEAASGSYWLNASPEHAYSIDGNRSWDPYPETRRSLRIDYCHALLGSLFAALSACGFDAVETGVAERYHDLASQSATGDSLCLALLEALAVECDDRLTPHQRERLFARTVEFLPKAAPDPDSVTATLNWLRETDLVETYSLSERSVGDETVTRRITITGDLLGSVDDRLPRFLLRIELRRRLLVPLSVQGVERLSERTWECRVSEDSPILGGVTT